MRTAQHAIDEAFGHLGAAISQSIPSDDRIIMEHVRIAHELLKVVSRAMREPIKGGQLD